MSDSAEHVLVIVDERITSFLSVIMGEYLSHYSSTRILAMSEPVYSAVY